MPDFDIKQFIHNYTSKAAKENFKNMALGVNYGSWTDVAIMAFFDTNIDGIVTKEEFAAKSNSELTTYMNSLFDYYEKEGIQEKHLKSEEYADRLKNLYNNKPFFGLAELFTKIGVFVYGNENDNEDEKTAYQKQLNNLNDENSNVVDWHIGTFNQGINGTCSLLAKIINMSDEELREFYTRIEDENGIYYRFDFPGDNKEHPVYVSQEELESGIVKLDETGERVNVGCSEGDYDVTLIEMAYLKRYGDKITRNGDYGENVTRRLLNKKDVWINDGEKIKENLELETNRHPVTSMIDIKSIRNYKRIKGTKTYILDKKDPENSERITVLNDKSSNGPMKIMLSDGQVIFAEHKYAVAKISDDYKTITLIDPHESSTEIELPIETFRDLFDGIYWDSD